MSCKVVSHQCRTFGRRGSPRITFLLVGLLTAILPVSDLVAQSTRDWRRAGFDYYDAGPWIEAELTPEEAIWWGSVLEPQLFLDRTQANWARIAGILTSHGLTTKLAQDWFAEFGHERIYYEDGAIGPSNYYSATDEFSIAVDYLEQGIAVDEAKLWRRVYASPSEVAQWKRAGLTPEDVGKWREVAKRAGYSVNASMVRSLASAGIDADTYVEWAAFIDSYGIELAANWIGAEIAADIAETYAYAGIPLANVPGIRESCSGDPEPRWTNVYLSNPYAAEGSCFFVDGIVHQLLGRTIVLAGHPRDSRLLMRADFAPHAAPGERTAFFVLGRAREPYRYTTVLGDEKIVVNLDVLDVLHASNR